MCQSRRKEKESINVICVSEGSTSNFESIHQLLHFLHFILLILHKLGFSFVKYCKIYKLHNPFHLLSVYRLSSKLTKVHSIPNPHLRQSLPYLSSSLSFTKNNKISLWMCPCFSRDMSIFNEVRRAICVTN